MHGPVPDKNLTTSILEESNQPHSPTTPPHKLIKCYSLTLNVGIYSTAAAKVSMQIIAIRIDYLFSGSIVSPDFKALSKPANEDEGSRISAEDLSIFQKVAKLMLSIDSELKLHKSRKAVEANEGDNFGHYKQ